MRQGGDPAEEALYQQKREEAEALKKKAKALKAARRQISGWLLMLGGVIYAFYFESPIGWAVSALGGGILSVKDAKAFLGK